MIVAWSTALFVCKTYKRILFGRITNSLISFLQILWCWENYKFHCTTLFVEYNVALWKMEFREYQKPKSFYFERLDFWGFINQIKNSANSLSVSSLLRHIPVHIKNQQSISGSISWKLGRGRWMRVRVFYYRN